MSEPPDAQVPSGGAAPVSVAPSPLPTGAAPVAIQGETAVATTPTTTILTGPTGPVFLPANVHLEAVVSPVPGSIDGFQPAMSFTLDGQFWRPSTIDGNGLSILDEPLAPGTYTFTARFGPWGDLEASESAPVEVTVTQKPALATDLAGTAVQSAHGFAGTTATHEFTSPGPDPALAVGPEHIVQATSAGFRFADRSGQPMFDVSFQDFFLETYGTSFHGHQPQVVFDDQHDRWLAVGTAWGPTGHLNLAISETADPTGFWGVYDFNLGSNRYAERPSLGVSTNKVGIGFDVHTSYPDFVGSRLLVIDTASILDGLNVITYEATSDDPGRMGWRVAMGQTTGGALHAVGVVPAPSEAHLLHMTVTGTVAAGLTFTAEDLTSGPLGLPSTGITPNGSGFYLPAGPLAAVWQSGKLWFVSNHGCIPPGADGVGACVRVTQLSTGATTGLVQDFVFGHGYSGGLGVTGSGDLVVAFTGDGMNLYAAVQKASDPRGSIHEPALVAPSALSSFPVWGPTTPLARDPNDPSVVWQGGALTRPTGWTTWISRLAIAGGGENGQLVIAGGRAHTNSLVFALGGTLAASDNATQVLVSNSPQLQGGLLELSKSYPISDEMWWSLAHPTTGGNSTTGLRTIYVQWGDGAGNWSSVENATITVDTPLGASFAPLNPARLLDTRVGNGLSGKFVSSTPRNFQVTGRGGVPANAVAVTGNLTVTGQTTAGYVFIGPTAPAAPTSSTLNVPLGDTRANGVTVKLSGGGKLGAVFVGRPGSTSHLIFDVTGYFAIADPNGNFGTTWRPIEPLRVLDTRNGTGLSGRLPSGAPAKFYVTGFGIPATAEAVTANVTVTGQTSAGYLYVGPAPSANPTSSTINVPKGDTRANNVTVRIGQYGMLAATWKGVAGSSAHFIVDVTGYFVHGPAGATYVPLTPVRLLDTRIGTGLSGRFAHGVPRTLAIGGSGNIPPTDTLGITANLTVTGQSSGGYAFVGPNPVADPTSSTINFPKGDTRANGLDVALSDGSTISAVYRGVVSATTHLIMDVTGYFR